ncbi:MAG: hypothetical protein JWP94_1704 [Mucilaginibacter sp.]|jgi:hypothetical protein|nr:hypothetical protein [Mucilaginibacter sp.]
MDSSEKNIPNSSPSRRKFVWGLGIFSLVTALGAAVKFPFSALKKVPANKSECKNTTIKMLTQDGRIVEIEATLMSSNRKKVTNTELQNWIKK